MRVLHLQLIRISNHFAVFQSQVSPLFFFPFFLSCGLHSSNMVRMNFSTRQLFILLHCVHKNQPVLRCTHMLDSRVAFMFWAGQSFGLTCVMFFRAALLGTVRPWGCFRGIGICSCPCCGRAPSWFVFMHLVWNDGACLLCKWSRIRLARGCGTRAHMVHVLNTASVVTPWIFSRHSCLLHFFQMSLRT